MTLVKYTHIKIIENNERLVNLENLGLIVEPKYFQQGLSGDSRIFLREEAAEKLLKVEKRLNRLHLKIWDGFRSRVIQNNIYQKYWSELKIAHPNWTDDQLKLEVGTFVSPPYQEERIPPHSTGGAVDLTLVDEDGKELDMGTRFDYFGPEAASFYFEIFRRQPEITKNRNILREVMLQEDFTLDEEEWWHFDYGSQTWALKNGKSSAFYGEVYTELLS